MPAIFGSDIERANFSFDGISENSFEHILQNGNFDQTLKKY